MKELFRFLSGLEQNNNREWFSEHKDEYMRLKVRFEDNISHLLSLISTYDNELKNITAKDCTYRIYRDIRFSPDKTPYKTHISAFMTKHGRKLNRAGYYLQLQSGKSMLCGGLWFPDAPLLKALRRAVYDNADELMGIMRRSEMQRLYPDFDYESSLKKIPSGFSADFPYPDLLKLKNFGVMYKVTDDYFYDKDWVEKVANDFRPIKEMNDFLNYTVDELNNR
ncbi:MAG: DUF2461 domain-containing protein [Bacteroidales bacterium]